MPAVFATLNDKSIPMETRLKLAWDTLVAIEDPDPRSEDQVAAKCWLTYRITDGTVEARHWPTLDACDPTFINDHGLELRWKISQLMAEVYLHGLRGDDWRLMGNKAQEIVGQKNNLMQWPGSLLNFLRASAVFAMVKSGSEERAFIVGRAICQWQNITSLLDWEKHPMRLVEMREDLPVLWQLLAIGKQCGYVHYEPFDWLPKLNTSPDLFAQLMRKLGAPGM